ncbi:hypothetical protein [Streptosporangium sp. NPDC051022]|uniref:hypothetical protein n=1 Tax=Streptosporangium sp. NPDC051022 TaxID=3155752 RepID=UPI00342F10D6
MRRGITPVLAATVPAAVLAAVLSGCGMLPGQQGGGGEERQPASQEERATGQGGSTSSTGQGDSGASTGSPDPAGPAPSAGSAGQGDAPVEQDRVIAARAVKAGGADLTVRITGLRRQGRLATLTWTVTNQGDVRWEMGSDMGDTPGGLGLTVAGISLVDPVNGKRYVVARTGQYPKATCLCSKYDVFTEPGEVLPLHATFAAPPPDVTKINLDLKVLGVFTDVPIS